MAILHSSHSSLAADAAIVAAELHAAGALAQNLSLVAKNTRTLVVRAGNTALGLKVITEYFSDLADEIISLTRAINRLAVQISKSSVQGWRNDNLCSSIQLAKGLAAGAHYVSSIDGVAKKGKQRSEALAVEFDTLLTKLDLELEEIRNLMRSTDVISVSFKLEAIQTGSHEKILTEMAAEIIRLSEQIKEKVNRSKDLVSSRRMAA